MSIFISTRVWAIRVPNTNKNYEKFFVEKPYDLENEDEQSLVQGSEFDHTSHCLILWSTCFLSQLCVCVCVCVCDAWNNNFLKILYLECLIFT